MSLNTQDGFLDKLRMTACAEVVRRYLPVVIAGVFLGALLSSAGMFLREGHINIAMVMISRWAVSSSRCSGVALDYLQIAERHILAANKNWSDRDIRLLDRVRHFQRVCELASPVEDICRFTFDLSSLSYQELEQPLPGAPQWILRAYWVDESAIELNEDVSTVLMWEVTDSDTLDSLPEEHLLSMQDTSGEEWCVGRDGGIVVQAGKARNLVHNGGFEWYNLANSEFPTHYTTNREGEGRGSEFFFFDMILGPSGIPTSIACLRGQEQFYAGLYQMIPVVEHGVLFLQGATAHTDNGALADIGGSWETPNRRYPAFAADRVDTDGGWVPYTQLMVSPAEAYRFSFRVANSGHAGTTCFDNIFVLSISLPGSLQ
jgi:hypothetical protein